MSLETERSNGHVKPFDEEKSDDVHRLQLLEFAAKCTGPTRRRVLAEYNLDENRISAWSHPRFLPVLESAAGRKFNSLVTETPSNDIRNTAKDISDQVHRATSANPIVLANDVTSVAESDDQPKDDGEEQRIEVEHVPRSDDRFLSAVPSDKLQSDSTDLLQPVEIKPTTSEPSPRKRAVRTPTTQSTAVLVHEESEKSRPHWLVSELPVPEEITSRQKTAREAEAKMILRQVDLIISGDPLMEKAWQDVQRAAKSDGNILLRGDTGTGKELLFYAVHLLHNAKGRRHMVNCPGISPSLIESELFGHVKGSFTNAISNREDGVFQIVADGGTLFLDEIGDLPEEQQAKLLRVLEARQFSPVGTTEVYDLKNTKIVSATNQPLEQLVEKGRFRKDLMYRLAGHTISIPSLAQRQPQHREDLIEHFIYQLQAKNNREIRMTEEALAIFQKATYSGNVRELRDHVIRAYAQAAWGHEGTVGIGAEHVLSTRGSENPLKEKLQDSEDTLSEFLDGAIRIDLSNDPSLKKLRMEIFPDKINGSPEILDRIVAIITMRLNQRVLINCEYNQSTVAERLDISRGKVRDQLRKAEVLFGKVNGKLISRRDYSKADPDDLE